MLDNPIWFALTTTHLAGLADQSPEAYAALAKLMPVGGQAGFFRDVLPDPPDGWTAVFRTSMHQMHCTEPKLFPDEHIVILGPADVPAMAELVQVTDPGPFGPRTIEFGTFYGIRDQGRLVAMAGERLHPGQYAEASAVCTHPDYRGRGYAAALVAAVTRGMLARGDLPMLHVRRENPAVRVYEQVGYRTERYLELLIVRRD